uniref:TatD family hydrolase n=1 Tax=Candidatus Cryptobacteroides bacterium TaxID=3085639 RepID=UPI003FEE0E98
MNDIFIDTHAHLYDPAFEGEEEEVVGRALAAGVKIILQPDIDSSERDGMLKLGDRFPEVFRNMAGLYPGSVEENWEEEVEKVKECAVNHNVIAIGEIGLDYHYSKDSAELQRRALKAQFEL